MEYTVLSPWAQTALTHTTGLNPRLDDLNGKTVGLYSHFKWSAPLFSRGVEDVIRSRFPNARFSYLQYRRDTAEIANDAAFDPQFRAWLAGVDVVVGSYADAGSCAMFLAYNMAYAEKLGVPAVLVTKRDMTAAARRGAAARGVPALRLVSCDMQDITVLPPAELYGTDEEVADRMIRPAVLAAGDELLRRLTAPLTPAERLSRKIEDADAGLTLSGSAEELERIFYQKGWTTGLPIVPPTRAAVDEMLRGTDCPPEEVIACMPPMLGKATVEKIAVNAVMAGCLPTYMPFLIAAVQAMTDPEIHFEGWTCSVAGWGMGLVANGPAAGDIGLNSGANYLSAYRKASAAMTRAISYMIMNIGGVRPGSEDMSHTGHENRFGVLFSEAEGSSPWPPLHTDFGLDAAEAAITLFWYKQSCGLAGLTADSVLRSMCAAGAGNGGSFGSGFVYVLPPLAARALADAGYSKQTVAEYISEYARQPATGLNTRLLVGNNHLPAGVLLPRDPGCSVRRFFSPKDLHIVVAGSDRSPYGTGFDATSCHGGPVCKAARLPRRWEELVKQYDRYTPDYKAY